MFTIREAQSKLSELDSTWYQCYRGFIFSAQFHIYSFSSSLVLFISNFVFNSTIVAILTMVEVVDQVVGSSSSVPTPITFDIGSPLYIHPSDSASLVLVHVPFDGVGF